MVRKVMVKKDVVAALNRYFNSPEGEAKLKGWRSQLAEGRFTAMFDELQALPRTLSEADRIRAWTTIMQKYLQPH